MADSVAVMAELLKIHLIIDTSQDISDVPYGDYFSVEGRWDVEKDRNDSKSGCILRVYTNVAFSKKTMWRGKIVQSTIEECREAYGIWMDLAHEVLKQKNLEKEQDDQVRQDKLAKAQQLAESNASDVPIPDDTEMIQNLDSPVHGNFGVPKTSSGSLFRDGFAKFSLKHQNTSFLLLVIAIAVILVLMQMSILVLLSRPQRIHVVSQLDYARSWRGGEAVASLSKQIKHLKEEMHFVENLLEKLQNEHARLNGKLKELEIIGNQRI